MRNVLLTSRILARAFKKENSKEQSTPRVGVVVLVEDLLARSDLLCLTRYPSDFMSALFNVTASSTFLGRS